MPTQCPLPLSKYPKIIMAHGGGGRLSKELYEKIFYPAFEHAELRRAHDGAFLNLPQSQSDTDSSLSPQQSTLQHSSSQIVMTTDSFVVHPIVFQGGDIGKLSVYGTVNDLLMCGSTPLYLSAAFILEEGFSIETLWSIVLSMKEAAQEAGVSIVTGDTKVVEKGKADGIYIITTGIGTMSGRSPTEPKTIQTGDHIIISGDLGRHGIAIMAEREGLRFENILKSDCASLREPIDFLRKEGSLIHCMRDLTRGGLSSALIELALSSGLEMEIEESKIPVSSEVQGACEMLGLDPSYVACEGRFILFAPPSESSKIINLLKKFPLTSAAKIIGKVNQSSSHPKVLLKTLLGGTRVLEMFTGEQLPRIC